MYTPRSASAGWVITRSSPIITGGSSSGAVGQSRMAPALRARDRVRQASPPTNTATSSLPAMISSAVLFTSDCGVLPPAEV